MRDGVVSEREEQRGAGIAIGCGRWLGWAGLMAFGPEKEGEGRTGRLRAVGKQRERRGSWAFGPEMREEGFYFFQILFFSYFKTKFKYEPNRIQILF